MASDKKRIRSRNGNADVTQGSLVHLSELPQGIHLRNSRQSSPQRIELPALQIKVPPTSLSEIGGFLLVGFFKTAFYPNILLSVFDKLHIPFDISIFVKNSIDPVFYQTVI